MEEAGYMNFEDLKNPELQEKLKACKSTDELIEFVKTEGVDLTDEQLRSVFGGGDSSDDWWSNLDFD